MKRKQHFAVLLSMLFFANRLMAQGPGTALYRGFQQPPDSVKPSVYWYWLSGNVSPGGVTRDVAAMSQVGIGRAFIGNIGLGAEVPAGPVQFFSPEWWTVTRAAMQAGADHHVAIGLFNGPGWSQSGGPWIKPGQSMRYLAASTTTVQGGQYITQKLPAPGKDFQDVAVLAIPAAPAAPVWNITSELTVTGIRNLTDDNITTTVQLPDSIHRMELRLQSAAPCTVRTLVLQGGQHAFYAKGRLEVNTGAGYKEVTSFEYDRSNPADNVGFMPWAPVVIALPPTPGKDFRLLLEEARGGISLADVQLDTLARVARYPEKQLGKMFPAPQPLWDTYLWPNDSPDTAQALSTRQVLDITRFMQPDGTLRWQAPRSAEPGVKGNTATTRWTILRMGMLPTGVHNAPATPDATGLEVDKLSAMAMAAHFSAFVKRVYDSLAPAQRSAFKYVVADSYETGSQNWTDDMRTAFRKTYGYDPLPWLPVLTGRVVGSPDQSSRFLWDLRRLVADRIAYQYVGALRRESHRLGLGLWLENYGHWGFPAEFLQYGGQSDEVGGEFWSEGALGSVELRDASSAAHIYGKTKVSAESFTAALATYYRYPAMLKKRGDWSFTEGVNNTLLHVFISQPDDSLRPGINAWFGTEFNRGNTWFKEGKAFIDYVRRCNYLLQQGLPVKDVAYFIGEDAPKMSGIRQPELPQGYDFDYINAEVLLTRAQVKDGTLVLPDGLRYRVLVLPPQTTMRPALLRKLDTLVRAGAVVVGPAPQQSPSLQDYPRADAMVQQLATKLWSRETIHHAGKGMVIHDMPLRDVFALLQLQPDLEWQQQPVLFTHRRTADGSDIYFISNQADSMIAFRPVFRVKALQPTYWDAVTGSARALPEYAQTPTGTAVPLTLAPAQSVFIVFNKRAGLQAINRRNFPEQRVLQTIQGTWQLQLDSLHLQLDTLQDWTTLADKRARYFSGSGVYEISVPVDSVPAHGPVLLDLGKVSAIAHVQVNGTDAGTVWTAPWQADVSHALKRGRNTIRITVVNTWVNALVGDQQLPKAQRKLHLSYDPFHADTPLQPAGLLGPVTLRAEVQ
ncbi:glycosyl hydrolase [Chitinophaga parva]|nr:glycosyl hydrolase [Chitinophaga parva]